MNPNITAQEIMSTNLKTLLPNEPLDRVKELFEKHTFHHIPIVEIGGKVVGIISRADWLKRLSQMAIETTGRTWISLQHEHQPVCEIMTTQPLSIDPEDPIGLAADIFLANTFHALPVVEDDQLVGLITTHDLLKYAFKSPI